MKTILLLKLSAFALTGYLITSSADVTAPFPIALHGFELMDSALSRLDGRRDPWIDSSRFLTFGTQASFTHLA